MRVGDRVFLWRAAGKKKGVSGVVAGGWIIEEPREQAEEPVALALWHRRQPATALRVWLAVDKVPKAKEVIQRDWLLEDPVLADLRILRLRSETNYPLSPEQAARLTALWENTGRDWSHAESIAGLWAYHHTYGGSVSRKPGSPVSDVALRIGRAASAVYNKVMNFRAIDPRDRRAGLDGAGAADRAVWEQFFDPAAGNIRGTALDEEYQRLWPIGGGSEPEAVNLEEAVSVTTGRATQGFISDPAVRRAVERRAMDLADTHYRVLYPVVEDTSKFKPYDLRCVDAAGNAIHVEVKSSIGDTQEIDVTANEVANAWRPGHRTDLFLVSHIRVVQTADGPRAEDGDVRVLEDWKPKPDELTPRVYRCRVPDIA
jgi:hypothetical protein